MTFDAYGMINRGSCILTVLHLYSDCSKHKLSTILTANAANLARFVTSRHFDSKKLLVFLCILSLRWFIYDWITIMEFSKHEISTINMLYFLKKSAILRPYLLKTDTFPQRLLSSFPKGAVVEMFDCNNAWTTTLFCQFLCYTCTTSTWKSLSYVIRRR